MKKAQYADYLLVYNDYPIVVIEAKKSKNSALHVAIHFSILKGDFHEKL